MDDPVVRNMGADAHGHRLMLLSAQCGVIDRSQAKQVGFSNRQIWYRLRSGRWQQVHEGIYATFTGPLTREARLWAALRRAGEEAILSHETAAEVHGLIDRPASKTVHVTVPAHRRPVRRAAISGIVIHRSAQSRPQLPSTWKLPLTRIEDTVLDLIDAAPTFQVAYGWIARAVSRRFTTTSMLRAALATRRRIRFRSELAVALGDSDDGIHSGLEFRYARDVERAHGLPSAQRQARREIAGKAHYRDNWYAEFRVCVELDGPTFHRESRCGRTSGATTSTLPRTGRRLSGSVPWK